MNTRLLQTMNGRSLLAGLILALATGPVAATPLPERPPNFIVIFADDLGYGDLSCFGNPGIRTPHLDRLAAEGQKWTSFYVADAVCTPSRAALLTGRYPIRNGMTSAKRAVLFPDSARGLPPEEVTIAEVLKARGYATAAIGKWHLGHRPPYLPTRQGFDSYYGIPYSNDMDGVPGAPAHYREHMADPAFMAPIANYQVPLLEDETEVERPVDQTTITRRFSDRAIAKIRELRDRPFFLYLAHALPHIPLYASPEFRGRSPRGLYGDAVEEIDDGVGRIVATLHELGLAENTIVLFTSDNGPWLTFRTHGGSAGPLRAGKGTTFEGGQRVPAIFWGPGRVRPGIITGLGSTLDVINTFASLAGAPLPVDRRLDGFDLAPVLRGETPSPRREFFFWTLGRLHAVRVGDWKLHLVQREPVNYGRVVELAQPELYDLGQDVGEQYDRAATQAEVVAALRARAAAHEADTADRLPEQLSERLTP